jgi:hypothetical protein
MADTSSTYTTPAPATTIRDTIDPSAHLSRNAALNSTTPVPKDFTTYMPPHLPTPPFIFVPGVPNFRDMGGFACRPPSSASSTTPKTRYQLRRNLLYRCAHPTQISTDGLMTLEALNITDIFDLRSAPEIAKLAGQPDPDAPFLTPQGHIALPGITRHFTPVYEAEDYGPVALARKLQWYTAAAAPETGYSAGFVSAYRDIGTYGARGGAYALILRQIIKSLDKLETEENAAKQQQQQQATASATSTTNSSSSTSGSRPGMRQRPVSVFAGLNGILEHQQRYPSPPPARQQQLEEGQNQRQGQDSQDSEKEEWDAPRTNGALVFHCTAGKDRTGVLAALIHLLVGVDLDDLAWEYAVTEPGLGSWRKTFIERISRQGGIGGPAGERAEAEADADAEAEGAEKGEKGDKDKKRQENKGLTRAEAARICGSRAANIRAFVALVVQGEWGGVERYLTEMVGLSEAEVARLRDGLVVPVEDEAEVVRRTDIEGWDVEMGMLEDRELE